MRCRTVLVLLTGILCSRVSCPAQATPSTPAYTFHVPADEISLRFHASDGNGKPLTKLTVADLELSDNGKAMRVTRTSVRPVDRCQRRHIAIYVIDRSRSSRGSEGNKTLNDLARQTGGRVFIPAKQTFCQICR